MRQHYVKPPIQRPRTLSPTCLSSLFCSPSMLTTLHFEPLEGTTIDFGHIPVGQTATRLVEVWLTRDTPSGFNDAVVSLSIENNVPLPPGWDVLGLKEASKGL